MNRTMRLFRWAMVVTGVGLIYTAGAAAVLEAEIVRDKKEAAK